MTSNLGSHYIQERMAEMEGKSDTERADIMDQTRQKVLEMLKQQIRPEVINRIDDIITFKPLDKEQIAKVVELQMNRVKKMLEPQGFDLQWTQEAINFLANKGYDPQYGARPVKRAIQDYVLNDLSKQLLSGKVTREKAIIIDCFGDELLFRN
jgi:ATP-dependent Clp protease ATP-binding subunit ClpB